MTAARPAIPPVRRARFNGTLRAMLINGWGMCPPSCPADVSPPPAGNGFVNVDDLLVVINN